MQLSATCWTNVCKNYLRDIRSANALSFVEIVLLSYVQKKFSLFIRASSVSIMTESNKFYTFNNLIGCSYTVTKLILICNI